MLRSWRIAVTQRHLWPRMVTVQRAGVCRPPSKRHILLSGQHWLASSRLIAIGDPAYYIHAHNRRNNQGEIHMSAYIVSTDTIDLIVAGAARFCKGEYFSCTGERDAPLTRDGFRVERIGWRDGDLIGAVLWAENHRSVESKYGDGTPLPPYRGGPR